jgi:hypothetical protein
VVEGCTETYVTECCYPDDGETQSKELFVGLLCREHAKEKGFCFGCGGFFAGIESFEFAKFWGNLEGYCEECSRQIKEDCGEYDEEDEEEYEYYEL